MTASFPLPLPAPRLDYQWRESRSRGFSLFLGRKIK
jgi:hypothetical protein